MAVRLVTLRFVSDPYALLSFLCRRAEASVDDTCATLGITADELRVLVASASDRGAEVTVNGRMLRLERPIELLDAASIRAALAAKGCIAAIEVLAEVDSTNAYLVAKSKESLPNGTVCFSEFQTAGRGRRGKAWIGQYGASVLASFYWSYRPDVRLDGLSLAVGVGLLRALRDLGARDVGLKWPNDLLGRGRKAAGILIETAQRPARGGWATVTGIGLNLAKASGMDEAIDQPWISLYELLDEPATRNTIAATMTASVLGALREYEDEGLSGFAVDWAEADLAFGNPVRVHAGNTIIDGVARGIDTDGALLVDVGNEIRTFHSAEVSLRLPPLANFPRRD